MHWTTDTDGVLDVPWGTILPSLSLAAGLGMSYANDPLTIYRDEGDERVRVASPVSGRAAAELTAALGVSDLLEFSLAMPLVLQQSSSAGSLMLPSTSSAGFGDLRLGAKLGVLRQKSFGVDGAATIVVGFPSAKDASYIGEAGPVAEPGLVVSRRFTDAWRATASLGYRVRERTASLALVVDDELVAQLGVGFKLAAMSGPAIDLGASLSVATAAGDALGSFDRNYAELKLGGGFSPMPSVAVILGGGVGMSQGFGTPDWRAFAGARFKFSVGDALSGGGGGDEVDVPKLDIKEAGRISREDVPPPKPTDDDGDGFMSDVDACPSQAETVNGYLDNDGCPDVLARSRQGRAPRRGPTSAPTSPRTSTATPTRTAAPIPTTTPTAWPIARTSARGCPAWSRPAAAPIPIATATPSSIASTTAPTSPAPRPTPAARPSSSCA
jgi:hypothetical protein